MSATSSCYNTYSTSPKKKEDMSSNGRQKMNEIPLPFLRAGSPPFEPKKRKTLRAPFCTITIHNYYQKHIVPQL